MQAGSRASSRKGVRPLRSYPEAERIDTDGLPHVGTVLYPGQAWHCIEDADTGDPCLLGQHCTGH